MLFSKKEKSRLSFSVFEVCFLQYACNPNATSHMGGDVFVIHTLKSKAVVSYFFSSVTQARIITVQLLACVAAAGRMASVGRPGESAFNCGVRRLFSVRCKSLKVRLHNVLLPFNSNFFVLCYQQYRALLYMYTSLFLWYFLKNRSPWFLWIVLFFRLCLMMWNSCRYIR